MNRVLLALLTLATALLTLAALAIAFTFASLTPVPGDDPPRHPGARAPEGSRYEDEPWVVLSASADGRVLRVQGGGGCGHDARATATETASTVAIRVQQLVPAQPSRVPCHAIARIDDLRVRLSAPIAGRPLIGQSLRGAAIGLSGHPRMPRVIGLRAADAAFALRAQGFHVSDVPRGTVRGQRPRSQTPAEPAHTAVTLLPTPAELPPLRRVPLHTVAIGGIASSLQRRTGLVVKNETHWRALWRVLTAGADPRSSPPRVAFSRDMLLIATQGRRPASGDHVSITSVADTGASLEVDVTDVSTPKRCTSADVSTSPYHVIRIPRSDEPVHFVGHPKRQPCDDASALEFVGSDGRLHVGPR